MAAILGLAY